MGSSILGIGQSALAAAQAGLATTGHNIANAATPGYSRQQIVMGSAGSQNYGFGYIGKGATIVDVKRVYSELLGGQVRTAETTKNQFETYYNQISRINNQLADPAVGLSPVLQDFFRGIQDLAANPNAAASRQAALSSAEALAARFQSLSENMSEVGESVNRQIESSVSSINVYAAQIAKLNDAIEKAAGNADGKASNDLLDQRDLALTELSKEIKTTIVKQGNSYSVFIGNGQPLVVGARPYNLVAAASPTDPMRIGVSYAGAGELRPLSEDSLPGGKLGGLFEFRKNSLDIAQNSLGRVAMGLALTFNAQHRLGQDQTGAMGGDFFNMPTTFRAASSSTNDTTAAAEIDFTVTNAGALTTSDYRLQRDGSNYVITRLSDKTQVYPTSTTADPTVFPSSVEIDGFTLNLASTNPPADGDVFLIRPTATAAASFSVAIKNTLNVAAAAPIRTAASMSNTGTGSVSAGTVNGPAPVDPNLKAPVTLTFTAPGQFTVSGAVPAVTGAVSYTPGQDISYNGWTVQISGAPGVGDTFSVSANNGLGDNRNAVLLGALQTANTLGGGTTSYQGAYAQLVSLVGNKAREMEVTSKAETKYLEQAITAQQAESGVNLDEEATNLMRYQQAYQAAGKVMQTANQMFEMLLTLGG